MKPGLRKRLFAWILKKGDSFNHKIYGDIKRDIFRNLSGLVAEVGPGTGVNLDYLPEGINWIGIEPNEAFHDVLRKKAGEKGIHAELVPGDALRIPLQDNTADAVICTLVLCSVSDPVKAIHEIKRVLKPGGRFIYIEHVAAPQHTRLRWAQNTFNPINRAFADGCNCNRETWTYLEQAGFSKVEVSHRRMEGTLKLHSPHITGYAVK